MKDFPNFRGKLVRSYPLASKTTWRVGGNAEIYAEPKDLEDLFCLLNAADRLGLPVYVLGRGSNLLINDDGVPGITVSLRSTLSYINVQEDNLIVGASMPMPALAKYVCRLGFTGFEHLIGIPGTVGAGVVINAGKGTGNDQDMRGILKSVKYITREMSLKNIEVNDLGLSYRSSCLKNTPNIVTEAVFALKNPLLPSEIEKRHRQILDERRRKFPLNLPNAGSVFKRNDQAPPAGKLIETAGLKGYRIGDAQVSTVHANFIVNLGNATAQDIKNLMSHIVEKVSTVHGVYLEREVIFWPDQMNWV